MEKSEINWKNGEVLAWDIDDLDLRKSVESQLDLLKEDLLLVQFGSIITLGLGWFPEFNPKGRFVLDVVKFENWKNPILRLEFRDLTQFIQNINQAVETANLETLN